MRRSTDLLAVVILVLAAMLIFMSWYKQQMDRDYNAVSTEIDRSIAQIKRDRAVYDSLYAVKSTKQDSIIKSIRARL